MHKGFLKRWIDISDDGFLAELGAALKGSQQVVFTGHSLGGAIAEQATLWYLQQTNSRRACCAAACLRMLSRRQPCFPGTLAKPRGQ